MMSSEKTANGYNFSCDFCGEVWEPPRLGIGSQSRSFGESWELAKEDGWRAVRKRTLRPGSEQWDEVWQHRCKDC